MSGKRLYRSVDDRMIAGVCGGLADYFSMDATLVRIILLFLALWGGGGVLAYLVAWVIIPEASITRTSASTPTVVDDVDEVVEVVAEVVDGE